MVENTERTLDLCQGLIFVHSSGLVMVAVIIGSRKAGINPDNVATPIAASLGDLITLSLLAGVSSFFFRYRGQKSHSSSGKHHNSLSGNRELIVQPCDIM